MTKSKVRQPLIPAHYNRYANLCWSRHIEPPCDYLVANRHFLENFSGEFGDPEYEKGTEHVNHDPHWGDSLLWTGIALATFSLEYQRTRSEIALERALKLMNTLRRLEIAGLEGGGPGGYLVRTDRGPEAPPSPNSLPSGSNYTGALLGGAIAHDVLSRYAPQHSEALNDLRERFKRIGWYLSNYGYFFFVPGQEDRYYMKDENLGQCERRPYLAARGVVARGAYAPIVYEHSFRQMLKQVTTVDYPSREPNLFKKVWYEEGHNYWNAPVCLVPPPPWCPTSKYPRQIYFKGMKAWAEILMPKIIKIIPDVLSEALGVAVDVVTALMQQIPHEYLPLAVISLGAWEKARVGAALARWLPAIAPDVAIFEWWVDRFADDFRCPSYTAKSLKDEDRQARACDIIVGQLIKHYVNEAESRFFVLLRINRLALQFGTGMVSYDDLHILFLNCLFGITSDSLLEEFREFYEVVKWLPGEGWACLENDRNPIFALIARWVARRFGKEKEGWVNDAYTLESIDLLSTFPFHLPNSDLESSDPSLYHQDYAWQRSPKERGRKYCAGHDSDNPSKSCQVEFPGLDFLFPHELLGAEGYDLLKGG